MVSPEHCIINPDRSEREKKTLEKQSNDNFEKFLTKFENYPVTFACLCGIDVHENLGNSGARKRKLSGENEPNEVTTKKKNEIRHKKIESEVLSLDRHETALATKMSREELQIEEKNKQEEKECKMLSCDGNNKFETNKKLVTNDSNQGTFDIQSSCDTDKTNPSGVEIFAAKCFTFNEFLTFLKIIYDYEPNCQDIDSAMSEVQSSISETYSSVFSSVSPSAKETPSVSTSLSADTSCDISVTLNQSDPCSVGNPCKNMEHVVTPENRNETQAHDFKVESGDKTVEKFASFLSDTCATHDSSDAALHSGSGLTVNIVDVINSILNPNVIKHIGQNLINKCKK